MRNADKFTGKAELYAKNRPGYPKELFDYLRDEAGFDKNSTIADIGSGTGIFSKMLLEICGKVFCIEPNDEMRQIAEMNLNGYSNFVSVKGMDINTTLQANSIDFITVAQAFHWFDLENFRLECQRILKPSGKVVLVWNSKITGDPATKRCEEICKKYCPDFKGFSGGLGMVDIRFDRNMNEGSKSCVEFFKDGIFQYKMFENNFYNDFNGYIGGNLSCSYAPGEKDENYRPFIDELADLFNEFSINGNIIIRNVTNSYLGDV